MQERITLTRRATIRFSEAEYHRLLELSDKAGVTLAEIIRTILLNKKVKIPTVIHYDYNLINELRRQGGLLKKYYTDTQGANSELTKETLKRIDILIGKLLAEANDR